MAPYNSIRFRNQKKKMKLRGPYSTKKEFITVELKRVFDAIHKWPVKCRKKSDFCRRRRRRCHCCRTTFSHKSFCSAVYPVCFFFT